MKVLGFVFARGGSKGVAGKNIRTLAGKPLVHYSIEAALSSSFVDRVFVSTDDHKIAEIALEAGAEVPFIRPAELAADDSPEWLAWRHAVKEIKNSGIEFDIFVTAPATSPLRAVVDIDNTIETLINNKEADAAVTVCKARRHPFFNMVVLDKENYAKIACSGEHHIYRRQDAPRMYDLTTVAYAVRPDHILHADSLFEGCVKAVVVPEERGLDIDTEFDFKIADFLIQEKLNLEK